MKDFTKVFPKCYGNNSNNITTNNNISESTSVTEENPNSNTNTNENLKKLLLINLYKMIPHLSNIRYTKFLHEKINNLFKKDSIFFVLKIFEEEFTSNNFSKEFNYLYKLLLCLLEKAFKL